MTDADGSAGVDVELSVIIVSYRTPELLDACLTTLRPQVGPEREVIVLDNASGDESVEMVADRHPWVRLVASEVNLGFGRGCNEAARKASGRWILLLNPDTEARPDTLDNILDFARRRPDGRLYGGRTVDEQGVLAPHSCWAAPSVWSTACFALGLSTAFPRSRFFDPEAMGTYLRDHERRVDIITGCLLLIERDFWDQLSGFDERYFMYGEDADLSMRATAAGARPMVTPRATVAHVVGASSTRSDKLVLLLSGKVTLMTSHFSPASRRAAVGLLVLGTWLRGWAWPRLLRRPQSAWTIAWRRREEWVTGY